MNPYPNTVITSRTRRSLRSPWLWVLAFWTALQASLVAATITTDKPDYGPTEVVQISGEGFGAGETVRFEIFLYPFGDLEAGESRGTWTTQAAADGTLTSTWQVCGEDCLGALLQLNALGLDSGAFATAFFTDGNVRFQVAGLPNGAVVSPITASFTKPNGDPGNESGSITVGSGNQSVNIAVKKDTSVSFSYPPTVTVGMVSYTLISVSETSPFFDGNGPDDVKIVTATYSGTPPELNCQNVVTGNSAGDCGALISPVPGVIGFPAPVLTYSIDGDPITFPYLFPVGAATTVDVLAVNAFGQDTCSFTVTVNDDEAPTVTCPEDIEVSNDAGECGAEVQFEIGSGDNCGVESVVAKLGDEVITSPHVFPVGVHTVNVVVTDTAGLTAECSFKVTVNDDEAPTVTCPEDIEVSNDAGECGAEVQFEIGSDDNCGVESVVAKLGDDEIASPHVFPVGVHTVKVLVTDTAGLTAECSFKVTVNDDEAPTVTCPEDIEVSNDAGECGAEVQFEIGSDDNCGVESVVAKLGDDEISSPHVFPVGVHTVNVLVTDTAGLTAECSFTVTVTDAEDPSVTCPEDIVQSIDDGECSAVVTFSLPTGADNCGVKSVVASPAPGSTFELGDTTVTVTVTDNNDRTVQCTFKVTVEDTVDPVITCPPALTAFEVPDPAATIADFEALGGTVSDNSGCTLTLSSSDEFSGGTSCADPLVVTRTYTVEDEAGNSSSCTQEITVLCATFVTTPGGCTFDMVRDGTGTCDLDPDVEDQQFRLIHIPTAEDPTKFRVNASNPGQFGMYALFIGVPDSEQVLKLGIPYPFITQGAQPIKVYSQYTITETSGQICITGDEQIQPISIDTATGALSPSGGAILTLADYPGAAMGLTSVIEVRVKVPASGLVLIGVHLDYGLKITSGWSRVGTNLDEAQGSGSFSGVKILQCQPYTFTFDDGLSDPFSHIVQSQNDFKRNAGFAGNVSTANPAVTLGGQAIEIRDSKGALVASGRTDSEGFYMIPFKQTGRGATYSVRVLGARIAPLSVTLKANGFGVANFQLP